MSKLKVLIVSLMCFFVVAGIFAGCKREKSKADVTIWHWMTDRQDAFDKLAQQYFEETGVKVAFETYAPSDAYKNKIAQREFKYRQNKRLEAFEKSNYDLAYKQHMLHNYLPSLFSNCFINLLYLFSRLCKR